MDERHTRGVDSAYSFRVASGGTVRKGRNTLRVAVALVAASILLAGCLTRYPYLTDPRTTSVNVNFATPGGSPAPEVRYGTTGSGCTGSTVTATGTAIQVNGQARTQWTAELHGPDRGHRILLPRDAGRKGSARQRPVADFPHGTRGVRYRSVLVRGPRRLGRRQCGRERSTCADRQQQRGPPPHDRRQRVCVRNADRLGRSVQQRSRVPPEPLLEAGCQPPGLPDSREPRFRGLRSTSPELPTDRPRRRVRRPLPG